MREITGLAWREKPGGDANRQKHRADPQQSNQRDKQLADGRQIAEQSALQVVLLELAIEDEKHDSGDRRKRKCAIGQNRHRGMRFLPCVRRCYANRIHVQHSRNQRDPLDHHDDWCGEHTEKGNPVGGTDDDVKQRQ